MAKRRDTSSGESSSPSPSDSDSAEPRHRRKRRESSRRRRRRRTPSDEPSSPSPSDSDSDSPEPRPRRKLHRRRRDQKRRRRRDGSEDDENESDAKRRKRHSKSRRRRRDRDGTDVEEGPGPKEITNSILHEFPHITNELRQLLEMIDKGDGVDISGISDKPLVKKLKKLFRSLELRQNESGAYLLSRKGCSTLEVIGPLLSSQSVVTSDHNHAFGLENTQPSSANVHKDSDAQPNLVNQEINPGPKRRLIGPAMPSQELLAAAAEMTEAIKVADLESDNDLLIGPPPPAVVAEAESANEAERFEEVTRIVEADINSPYDVLGVNWKMTAENIKKRYWKLSLMVHPDKCSHPLTHEAFVKLNKAYKDLQDVDKRGIIDKRLQEKEEQAKFEVELRSLREAAQWRKLQGISMEGDDELLAVPKEPPKRDEWMTTLPPERKPGMSMQSRTFSKSGKEGRGDTSMWTNGPNERSHKAKQNYLEAYDRAKAIAAADEEKRTTSDASLVDSYNSSRRSTSLVQRHQQEMKKAAKKKSKQQKQDEQEWSGSHPWKPWDREKDLGAGRQKVDFDADNMAQGLSSRFSSGAFQRNFL